LGHGNALYNISMVLNKLGNRALARERARAALEIYLEMGDPWSEEVKEFLTELDDGNES